MNKCVMTVRQIIAVLWIVGLARLAIAADAPPLHIESIVPSLHQPQENDPAIIWYDDFNGPEKPYGEKQGELDSAESFGGSGRSLLC
ncbi:MAG TPA: hypothetical protein VFA40_02015, partial [Terriglobales bacterium]|nr:hypothetical protein [Terriglobales bacterium]